MQSIGLQRFGAKAQCATPSSSSAARPFAGAPLALHHVRASTAAAPACRPAAQAPSLPHRRALVVPRAGPPESEFDVDSAPPPEQLGVDLGPREDDVRARDEAAVGACVIAWAAWYPA